MKKRTIFITTALSSILCLAITTGVNIATAQSSSDSGNHGQALEISPPVINMAVDPGQTFTTKINIRNISGGSLVISGQINDFLAAGEDGTPKIIEDEKNTEKNPYSIINWVSPMPELNLASKQMEELPVTVTVPKDAAPGGHYGVVRFTGTPPELEGTGMSLSASLGSLIILRVNGDVKEDLSLTDFYVSQNGNKGWFFESTPIVVSERITNNGNIHEQPTGTVTVTDMFGRRLSTLAVNQVTPPGNILPDSTRLFNQDLNSKATSNRILFGRYDAKLDLTYGDKKISKTITFWVIPYKLIAAIIIILVALFFILRFGLRNYNKRIIAKATGQPVKKHKTKK